MLEKLPGVASADADKTTSSATIVYDKSVFDTSSLGDEGRYTFELRQDSAAEQDTAGGSGSSNDEQASDESQSESSSMIKIEDAPADDGASGSIDSGGAGAMPSLDGPG